MYRDDFGHDDLDQVVDLNGRMMIAMIADFR